MVSLNRVLSKQNWFINLFEEPSRKAVIMASYGALKAAQAPKALAANR